MTTLTALTDLTMNQLAILAAITFVAGLVRGFSGFALSAMVMASAVLILPPIQLIPVCWVLEMVASALMARGGWADADRTVTIGLVGGSALGLPIGLALTSSIDVATSKLVALTLIILLATAQLAKLRIPVLATRKGLWGSGILSGLATGLASVGGMVVAVYILAANSPARQMRGSLVVYLLASSVVSLVMLLWFGIMNNTAFARGLTLALPAALGVIGGKLLFTPRFEPYYRPFCLTLLMGLASIGLIRTAF